MKHPVRIIMLQSSAFPLASMAEHGESGAVANVTWYEQHGDMVLHFSERWKLIAPNILLATSPKR